MKSLQLGLRLFACGVILILSACSGLESTVMSAGGTAAANKATAKSTMSDAKQLPDTLEFGDVLVPREMDVNKEYSFIHERNGQLFGLLRTAGRVEMKSLMRFFRNNLTHDGWHQNSELSSSDAIQVFDKPNRMCIIMYENSDFQTFADIWVVPMNETVEFPPPK